MDESSKWYCYVCSPEPLVDLATGCSKVMQNLERLWCREHKPKTNKSDRKKDKAAFNGKEHHSEGSGTLTFSPKLLQIPKELVKKTKKLIETTTGLNNTFVQFIQQASKDKGTKPMLRYRHLKAFKSVLADLKMAHATLEHALEAEFRELELQNGAEAAVDHGPVEHRVVTQTEPTGQNEQTDQIEPTGHTEQAEQAKVDEDQSNNAIDGSDCEDNADYMDIDAVEMKDSPIRSPTKQLFNESEVREEEDEDEEEEEEEEEDNVKPDGECGVQEDGNLLVEDSSEIDREILSATPSIPDELFQMVESLADSTKLAAADEAREAKVAELSPEEAQPTEAKEADEKPSGAQKRIATLGKKKLVVKLTPMPLRISLKAAVEPAKEDGDGSVTPEDGLKSRRSPRVKTTPLRKPSERKSKSNGKQDTDKKTKAKVKTTTTSGDQEEVAAAKVSSTQGDSDSDEVPLVLRQRALLEASSGDEVASSGKKAKDESLSKPAVRPSERRSTKRKLTPKATSSDSDQEAGAKKSAAKSVAKSVSKKKKNASSDSENDDSDVEKEIKGLSKLGTVKKGRGKVKQESKETLEKVAKTKKRSFERTRRTKRGKVSASRSPSSSDHEEEEEQAEDSGEDSDDKQKMRPIMDSVMAGIDSFQQSSGESHPRDTQRVSFHDFINTLQ